MQPFRDNAGSRFYLYMALLFLAIAATGFSTTYFVPLARGSFTAPRVIHLHGAALFGWLLLLIVQAWLIQQRRVAVHRLLGWTGAVVAVLIVISGVLVGLYATRRDLAAGDDPFALGGFVNILIEMLVFGSLVTLAVVWRRDGQSHKRLLLLATISALAPAWLRLRHLFPGVPAPILTFSLAADSMLLVCIARDLVATRRIHPVYIWAGGAMVAIHLVELSAMTSQPWLRLSRWLLGMPAG